MTNWMGKRLAQMIFPTEPVRPTTAMHKVSPETARVIGQHPEVFAEIAALIATDTFNIHQYGAQTAVKKALDQVFTLGVIVGLAAGPAVTLIFDVVPMLIDWWHASE